MQLFEKAKHKPGINLAPLIDILFLLIIFFTVSSKIVGESGIGLVLPKSRQGNSVSVMLPVLSVNSKQQIWLNNVSIQLESLHQEFQKILKSSAQKTIILNIDKSVTHGLAISIMDEAKTSGFQKIIFGTESIKKN